MQTIDEIMNSRFELSSRKLPKLYRVIKVELNVLRDTVGANLGVIFDCDDTAVRKVRRVACPSGWKWQIVTEYDEQWIWDYYFDSDKECLEDINYEYGLLD